MRSKTYLIDIPPLAWSRAGATTKRGYLTFFDGQAKDKTMFGLMALKQHGNDKQFSCPIDVNITFHMPMNKTKYKSVEGDWCMGKKDLDNLEKFLLDALVDAEILKDDNIVCSMSAKKIYSKKPCYEFIITELD